MPFDYKQANKSRKSWIRTVRLTSLSWIELHKNFTQKMSWNVIVHGIASCTSQCHQDERIWCKHAQYRLRTSLLFTIVYFQIKTFNMGQSSACILQSNHDSRPSNSWSALSTKNTNLNNPSGIGHKRFLNTGHQHVCDVTVSSYSTNGQNDYDFFT